MNRLLFSLLLILFVATAAAQNLHPVKWTYTVEQKNPGEATLVFTANIEKGWHIYSQVTPDGGPLPTVFSFNAGKSFELIGKPSEPAPHEEYDSTFEVKVLTLDGNPVFRQKIKLNESALNITGRIDGQVCKDVCIMFGDEFRFDLGEKKNEGASTK